MSKSIGKPLGNNRRGNMPFALVAVALLLIASSYCAVSTMVQDHGSETENIRTDISVLEKAPESAASFIETGLGKIIYDVCTDPDLGALDGRCAAFRESMDSWMEFQFPMEDCGVTMNLVGYSIDLQTEKMTVGDGPIGTEGYVPSYLKAVGTVKIDFESDSGKTTETVRVSTDGSCALPLVLEAGSMFENAVTGGGSMLSQMVNYQLTSLAQYRVINGYGTMQQFGARGTDSVITEKDVLQAYRNALDALECMFFRDSSGNSYFGTADLANALIAKNGKISVDLNSVYAQALSGHIDNVIGKWFDYLLGNVVVDICDYISDFVRNLWDSFVSFLTGKNEFSAEPYIRNIVGDADLSVCSGETFVFYVYFPETDEKIPCTVAYPDVDIYDSEIVKKFKSHYRANTDSVMNWIRAVVNGAIYRIADSKDLGTAELDVSDGETFADALAKAVSESAMNRRSSFESIVKSTMDSHDFPDQFYSAIYATLDAHKNQLFSYSEEAFNANTARQLSGIVFQSDSCPSDPDAVADAVQKSFLLPENRETVKQYQKKVGEAMQTLSALNGVKGQDRDLAKTVSTAFFEAGFLAIDCTSDIKKIAMAMCDEYRTNIGINPLGGIQNYPDGDSFTLTGDGVYYEKITVSDCSNPYADVKIDSDKSTHEVGFEESSDASYCTVFSVSVRDTLTFAAKSSGTLPAMLGLDDSVFDDTVEIDMKTSVSVVSGCALAGVEYNSSTDILQDLYKLLLKALEPLLEPLRNLLRMAEDVMNKLSQAIMQINQYLTELMEKLYETVMGPLEKFNNLVSEKFTEAFCDALVRVIEGSEAIVDVSAVNQKVGFTYMGFTLLFTFNLPSLEKYTKSIVKAEFSGDVCGNNVSAFVSIKTKGETKKTPCITGGFSITGDSWDIHAVIDPTMTTNKNFMSLSGTVKGVKIDAVLPRAVQYNEIGISLSDIPGIGTVLSNIPSPIAGTKIQINAGISLKYDLPLVSGILINEFESNPEGEDKGHEWAEILNNSGTEVNLSGWTLTTSKNKIHNIKEVILAPSERTVVFFEGSFLNNSRESLTLKDPDGEIIDKTPAMSDGYNDDRTVQRATDGSTEWSLLKGTCGERNLSSVLGENGAMASVMKDIVKKASVKAMDEMRRVTTVSELSELFVKVIQYSVDDSIDRISDCMIEGTVYVSAEFSDLADANRAGFRIYVMVDGDLVEDVLRFLLGKAEALFMNIQDPYNISVDSVLYDDVYVGVSVFGGIKAPSFLCGKSSDSEKVTMEVDIACNLSAIGSLLDKNLGTPKVKVQIGIKNCPYGMVPKPLAVKKNMSYDLWFMSATFSPA